MKIDIKKAEEDFDTRYVDYLGARFSLSGACHLARYNWVKTFVKGKTVLDAGCGSGYGDNILAKEAKRIVGIDISEAAILYAKSKYNRPNISFFVADLTKKIAFNDKFNVVISFDVLEHINDADSYIKTLLGFLDDNGTLIIGTPNRLVQELYNTTWNPFHVKEYTPNELKALLFRFFNDAELIGQAIINDHKDEQFQIKINKDRKSINVRPDVDKQKSSFKEVLKRIFPFWLKEAYKLIRLCVYFVFKRHKLIFIEDIGFSKKDINKSCGIIVVCRSRK